MFGLTTLRAAVEAVRFPVAGSSRSVASVHLGNLAPSKGSTKTNVRRGRGQGSGMAGTAGRGHKGQLARNGNRKPVPGFEGGQTPITRLFPKRGFLNFTRRAYAPLPLARLQQFISQGRIDTSSPITVGTIVRANAVHGISGMAGVKLLGPADPELPLPPVELELSRFSKSAADAVLEAGGKVTAVYHNNLSLRQAVWPEKFVGRDVKDARPIRRTDIEYYTDAEKYGYLADKREEVLAQARKQL